MLKKTGIVLATVATGLIGLSSLAFAADEVSGNDKVTVSEDNDTRTETDNSQMIKQWNDCNFEQEQEGSTLVEALPAPAPVAGTPTDGPDLGAQSQDGSCVNTADNTPADVLPI